jgi:hypothetical protein
MDVHSCDYGDCDDDFSLRGHMANTGILCLFPPGIYFSESFCSATRSESSIDILFFMVMARIKTPGGLSLLNRLMRD